MKDNAKRLGEALITAIQIITSEVKQAFLPATDSAAPMAEPVSSPETNVVPFPSSAPAAAMPPAAKTTKPPKAKAPKPPKSAAQVVPPAASAPVVPPAASAPVMPPAAAPVVPPAASAPVAAVPPAAAPVPATVDPLADAKKALGGYVTANGPDAALALLQKYGASRLGEVSEENLPGLVSELRA